MPQSDQSAIATELFRSLFEQSPDALIFADAEGAIRLWNSSAERVFGYASRDVVGRSLDAIIPERFREAHWRGFRQAVDTGSTKYAGRALTTRAVHKAGRPLYVALTFALISDAGAVVGVLAAARDCTESHVARRALRDPAAAAEKRDRGT